MDISEPGKMDYRVILRIQLAHEVRNLPKSIKPAILNLPPVGQISPPEGRQVAR